MRPVSMMEQSVEVRISNRIARSARYLGRNVTGVIGLCVVILMIAIALFAPLLAPFDPQAQMWQVRLRPPSITPLIGETPNVLGTDGLGRDVLSRLIFGTRVSLIVGFGGMVVATILGTALGLISGYYGGRVDSIIMRAADIQLAFPFILLVLVLVAVIGPSLTTIVLVLGLAGWVIFARMVRAEVLKFREREFVEASRALGASDARIVLRHILPNVLAPILVTATLQVPRLILVEASLSFLGLGVPPGVPSWGAMLSQGKDLVYVAWWLGVFPGIAITVTILGVNLLGDWLRDVFDPKLRT